MMLWPAPPSRSSSTPGVQGTAQYPLSQQQTQPFVSAPSNSGNPVDPPLPEQRPEQSRTYRRRYARIFAIAVIVALTITLYFIWNSPTAPTSAPSISQQNFSSTSSSDNSSSSATDSGDIKVYVVGAVKHPGVYTLPPDARVSDLLQAAGGPLPDANLVALNLAAKLSDGQEVYVITIGEIPPTYAGGVPGPGTDTTSGGNTATGSLVNINTATVDEMRQNLHVSSTTAQNIVNYRTQNGPFTSVDQLLQVVSKSIYDKIKDLVTV